MNEDADTLGRTLQCVAQKLGELRAQHEAHLKATKGRFNLFTLLLNRGDETCLHSKYLAHLLDPKGLHDCGDLFLKLFLEVLRERRVQPHADDAEADTLECLKDFDSEKANVRSEVSVNEGRLDILIESSWGAIAIENKIWAQEQDRQLERYATYLKDRQFVLLYLTLNGKASETAFGSKYYRISYREHILPWLEVCLRATYPHVNINQALQQYKNVICQLVGHGTLEMEYMKPIKKIIEDNPTILTHLDSIVEAKDEMMRDYRNRFFQDIVDALKKDGIEIGQRHDDNRLISFGIVSTRTGRIFEEPKMEVRVELWRPEKGVLYIGVSTHHCKDAAERYRKQLQALNNQLCENDRTHQRGWGSASWPANTLILRHPCFDSPEYLADLINKPEKIQSEVENVVAQIQKYVAHVESIWKTVCAAAQ